MTLVFRSPKLVQVINNQNPGPGAYRIKEFKQHGQHPSAVFLSKVHRDNSHMEETDLGPFSYFKENLPTENKGETIQSVFKSKIERFASREEKTKQLSKQNEFAQEFNQLMKKQRNQHAYKGKVIDLKLKKQKEQKLNDLQRLPSIPSHQHSYGYRVDYNTNKLVNNYNPKVIFTQPLKSNEKENFYFQRSHNSLGNTKKCVLINTNAKRSQNQLTHQLNNPTLNAYNADKYYTIEQQSKKVKNHSNCHSILPRFNNENSPSKLQLLRMNKIKRQFQMYIGDDHINLKELQNSKYQNRSPKKSPIKKIQRVPPECFLTRQSRAK